MKAIALVSFPLLIVGLAMALSMSLQTQSASLAEAQNPAVAAAAIPAMTASAVSQAKAPPVSASRAAGEQELRDMEAKFAAAVAAKDSQAFLAFWAEDAAMFPAGEPVAIGKEKILEEWAPILSDPTVSLTWSPDKAEISGSGDLGYTYGKYRWTGKGPDGQSTVRNGKYVTIWREGPDGKWRVVVDLGTPSDPPPAKPAH